MVTSNLSVCLLLLFIFHTIHGANQIKFRQSIDESKKIHQLPHGVKNNKIIVKNKFAFHDRQKQIIDEKNNYNFIFNDKCSIISNPKFSKYSSHYKTPSSYRSNRHHNQSSIFNKQHHHSKKYHDSYTLPPVFIHIDHKFTHGLGHAFDVYGIGIAISLRYNFTIVYEPLLHDHNHGNHSISYHSIQSNDFDFLGLQLYTVNRTKIELLYDNNLDIISLNQPCSSYNFYNKAEIKTISPVSIDSIYADIDNILMKRDINSKPLLIQACGFPISYKFLTDHLEIYDYWRSRMEQQAILISHKNKNKSVSLFNDVSSSRSGRSSSSRGSSSSIDSNHNLIGWNNYRDIAVHIRRGDFLLPTYRHRLLSDDYYVDIICHLLSILDNDKINRFIILSESNIQQQQKSNYEGISTKITSVYLDERSQPSDLYKKIQSKCHSYTLKSKWELLYMIDASVLVTLKTMIYPSFLITSKSGFSRLTLCIDIMKILCLCV